jgi:enoyl-CoA hydratase
MITYEEFPDITARREDRVLILSLDRPDSLNAITAGLHAQLADVFRHVAADADVDVLVLTGAGRAFSAGGDLDWIQSQPREEYDQGFREARRIILDLLELPQPIVAAVNGHAIGLGATIALFCDFVYASERALIGDPHIVLGLVPGDGASIVWPLVGGLIRAKHHLLTGEPIAAPAAARAGMVTDALPPDEVLPTALVTAHRLASLPQIALRGTKSALNAALRHRVTAEIETSLAIERLSRESDEHRQALDAYVANLRAGSAASA